MNITVDSSGSYLQNGGADSIASNSFYASFQGGASTANNPDNNFDFLQGVVSNWNTNYSPDLPTPVNLAVCVDDIGDTPTFDAVAGYDYVVFHFGTGQAGGGNDDNENGWWSAWYLGGESFTFTLPQEGSPPQSVGGFSSACYFNGTTTTVPDGGSTFFALGIGLLGLGGVRRYLLKS